MGSGYSDTLQVTEANCCNACAVARICCNNENCFSVYVYYVKCLRCKHFFAKKTFQKSIDKYTCQWYNTP